MCGLGAVLRADGSPIPDQWLDLIERRIAHRGPDGRGRFRDRVEHGGRAVEVALVHARLSVIDHEGGAQPMVSGTGPGGSGGLVAVVANGCIYNHRELRAELESRGHRFVSDHSDTEVLLHGHREWGTGLQEHLEGMYAFALWDRDAATLTLGRDWFGEKPLYHRMDADLIVAASDPVAVAGVGDGPGLAAPRQREWLARYLRFGYARAGRALSPGGVLVGKVAPSGHARAFGAAGAEPPAGDDAVERLLDRAVARRLEADVPLGCFLSGGVDSSLVAAFARRHRPDLRTFAVRMPDPRYDESGHAQRVAARLGTRHTTLEVAPEPARDLVMLTELLGQPFGDSSILPTYWVSRAARQHVTVALSGDGGDELFVGYLRYGAARLLARYAPLLRFVPSGPLCRAHPRNVLHKLGRLGEMARDFPELGVLATEPLFTTPQLRALLGEAPPPEEPAPAPPGPDRDDPLAQLRWADLTGYLPDDLLHKVDTASMAVALEVRCPYLDRELAASVLAAPVDALLSGGRKGLLRRIARRHLPREAVDRPKMGFAIPIGRWFRTDYGGLRALLLDHLHSAEPFGRFQLDRLAVGRLLDEHMAGKRDHGHRLFALLSLSIWSRSAR